MGNEISSDAWRTRQSWCSATFKVDDNRCFKLSRYDPLPTTAFISTKLCSFCVLNSDPYTASIRCTDSKISVVVLYKRFNFRKSNFIASNSTRIFKGRYLYRSDLAYSCCKVNMVSQCKGRRFIVVPDQPASPLQSALPYLTRGGNPMRFLSVWSRHRPCPVLPSFLLHASFLPKGLA